MHPNLKAFLDTIAFSEIGPLMLSQSDNGYDVCVGSIPGHLIKFSSYVNHPRIRSEETNSDAAGRYQFMGRYWEYYKRVLNLPDFGHESQDKWAVQLIRECRAYDLVIAGKFADAVHACRSRWASFPGAGYNQHENSLASLQAAYVKAGGVVA